MNSIFAKKLTRSSRKLSQSPCDLVCIGLERKKNAYAINASAVWAVLKVKHLHVWVCVTSLHLIFPHSIHLPEMDFMTSFFFRAE